MYGDGKGVIWRWWGGESFLNGRSGRSPNGRHHCAHQLFILCLGILNFVQLPFQGLWGIFIGSKLISQWLRSIEWEGGGYLLHNVTATSSLLLSRDYKESPPSAQLVGVLWVGGDVGGGGSEDNIPGERVVCHPPARARRRATKTWNMNFWRRWHWWGGQEGRWGAWWWF